MTYDEHRKALEDWIEPIVNTYYKSDDRALAEALYSFRALEMLDLARDVDVVVRMWAIVSAVRKGGFPGKLRM